MSPSYKVTKIPAKFLINEQGVVVWRKFGAVSETELEEQIHNLKWKVTGGVSPIQVTIEVTGPDGKKQTIDVKELEGTRTFSLAYPGGGNASVKVTAKDASNASSTAQSSVQLGKCQ